MKDFTKIERSDLPKIVAFGCGVDSVSLIALMWKLSITPDAIIFADTGNEKQVTYDYLEYFNPILKAIGFPEITIVRYTTKEGEILTLGQDCLNNKTLPGIVFGYKSCSEKFKIRPTEKHIKHVLKIKQHERYIGFNFGEKRRKRESENKNVINKFLLIDYELDRSDCIDLIKSMGWKVPVKSACKFCPSSKKYEILSLTPEDKKECIEMEANATNVMEVKGLGRNFAWTDLFYMDETQLDLFDHLELVQQNCDCPE